MKSIVVFHPTLYSPRFPFAHCCAADIAGGAEAVALIDAVMKFGESHTVQRRSNTFFLEVVSRVQSLAALVWA